MKEVSDMEQVYIDTAKILKAISDPKRLRIVDMLSCGELCACKILEAFHITQPTLSHDMRVLIEAGIVRTCIHKRLSRVWKWEIRTIVSAEETEIS